jgi:hypothetical protein
MHRGCQSTGAERGKKGFGLSLGGSSLSEGWCEQRGLEKGAVGQPRLGRGLLREGP